MSTNNLIKNILSQIKTIVQTITRNPKKTAYRKDIAKQLQENGYNYFSGEKSIEAAHVIKILALAINDNLVEKFDIQRLQKGNNDEFDRAVEDLGDRLNVEGSVKDSLLKEKTNWSSLAKAKCPLAFAKFLMKNGSEVFVRRLIEHQYEIKWATKGEGHGRPEPFNFYDFCDKEQSLKYLQYNPRTAHTKVTLYQECFKKSPQFSKIELCPDVHMKTNEGWKKQSAGRENNNLRWMNESIRNFLNTEADKIKFEDLKASLEKKMVYLAVIEDTDFAESRKELKLCGMSKYQGYVGKANNGILGRWLEDSGSHCEKMKKCLDNVNAMTNYNPISLEGIQLVDVRLALAKVRKENCALFVMKIFDDEEEKAAELSWNNAKKEFENAKKSFTGTEDSKYSKQTLDDLEKKSEEAKKLYYTARMEILTNLDNKEKQYREGIQLEIENETFTWYLKDMKFGMNNK